MRFLCGEVYWTNLPGKLRGRGENFIRTLWWNRCLDFQRNFGRWDWVEAMFWRSFVVRKWFEMLQDAPKSQTFFETFGDFGGRFLLMLRERVWDRGGSLCEMRILNLGLGLNKLPVSTQHIRKILVFRVTRTFWKSTNVILSSLIV